MKEIDWLELWCELVTRNTRPKTDKRLVERYRAHSRKRTERLDPLLEVVLKEMDERDAVIEIGPGTGRWTIPVAKRVRSVTAIEPSAGMVDILRENLNHAGFHNVEILSQTWEDASPSIHDAVMCSHGMYGSPDLAAFVRKMERFAHKSCWLALRLPPGNGIMAELSLKIHGCRHDSPDAVIAWNALYALGIHANVLVEEGMENWVNDTLDDAFSRAKRHLRLETDETKYDDLIYSTLRRRLSLSNGVYIWPDGMRSALLRWSSHRKD